MGTTVTLADDVAAAVDGLGRERGVGVSAAVNELVRRGLTRAPRPEPFVQRRSRMGPASLPLNDVAGLLDVVEGPDRQS